MSRIIIIGAGPASFILSRELAKKDMSVYIFDHKAPWEKPCGGILPHKVITEFVDINSYPHPYQLYNGIHLIAPGNDVSYIQFKEPFYAVSRKDLSASMLKQLHGYGIAIVPERVTHIRYHDRKWHVTSGNKEYVSDILVGADGVNSLTRRMVLEEIPKSYRYLACGYYISDINFNKCVVKFSNIEGYMWILSCSRHSTAGILVQNETLNHKTLFNYLDEFINETYPSARIIGKYSAYIPSISDPSFYDQPCAGENWALLGDAAGHVEPLIGEGIYYALKSGELAAEAIIAGDVQSYDTKWRDAYGEKLIANSTYKKTILDLSSQFGPEMYGAFLYNNLCTNFNLM